MADPEELRQFKQYLAGKGKNYEDLDENKLLCWSETYDKFQVLQSQIPPQQAGKNFHFGAFQSILILIKNIFGFRNQYRY